MPCLKNKTTPTHPKKTPLYLVTLKARYIFNPAGGGGVSGELLYPSVMVDIFDIKISCTQGTEVCRHNHDRQKHILINVKREH